MNVRDAVLSGSLSGGDRAVGDDDDVLSAELLLELVDKTRLDLAEGGEILVERGDDNGALSLADLDLGGAADGDGSEDRKVGDVLELKKGSLDREFELCGWVGGALQDLFAGREDQRALLCLQMVKDDG